MSDFDFAVERTLAHEGGLVDHPDDPGGVTNFGISLRFYRRHIDPSASADAIRGLTKQDAISIYYEHFWRAEYYDFERSLAAKVFDLAVNMGPNKAHRLLQQALAAAGKAVAVDGALGPETCDAVGRCDPMVLLAALRSEAAGRYRVLVAHNPSFRAFIRGWLRRAYS